MCEIESLPTAIMISSETNKIFMRWPHIKQNKIFMK